MLILIYITVFALIAWFIVWLVNWIINKTKENAEKISDSIQNSSKSKELLSYEEFQELKKKAAEDPDYAKYLKSQGIDL